MATYAVTINAVTRQLQTGWSIAHVINGLDVLTADVLSLNRAYVPTLGHAIIITEDGTPIFGGLIDQIHERGHKNKPVDHVVSEITAKGFAQYAHRVRLTETFAAGTTLKSALEVIETYLTVFGVSLDASQVNGPNLSADLVFDGVQVSEVLNQLTGLTGYVWEIDASKELRMYDPGSVAAPFDLTVAAGIEREDITVERSRDKYYNRVVVRFGTGLVEVTDTFTGDGSTTTFELSVPIVSWRGYVTNNAVNETISLVGGGGTWEYDPTALPYPTIERTSAPANTNPISIIYTGQFPAVVSAEDASYATDPSELVVAEPTVFNRLQAQAIADALLARYLVSTVELVTFETREIGVKPGQSLDITVADRGISGTFMVSEVNVLADANLKTIRTVKAIGGDTFRGSFRNLYIDWLTDTGGGGTSTAGPALSSPGAYGAIPASPDRSVQFNNSGAFGGSSMFLWKGTATYSGFPANLRVEVEDESRYNIALVGPDATFWVGQVYNNGDIIWNGGRDYSVLSSRDILHDAAREFIVRVGNQFSDAIKLEGLVACQGLAVQVLRTTATTYTIDTTAGTPLTVLLCVADGGAITVNLPALAAASSNPITSGYRVLCIRNDGASNNVTVDPDSSETIDGTTTYTLTPGQSIAICSLTGTGAGWKVLASHG